MWPTLTLDAEIIHGECVEIMRRMEAGTFDAVVTDPPYGTGGRRRPTRGGGRNATARLARDEWDQWSVEWVPEAVRLLTTGARVACFCPVVRIGDMIAAARAAGLPYLTRVVWRKPDPMPPYRGRLAQAVEDALIFGSGPLGADGEHNVWVGSAPRAGRDADGTGHPNQKPIGLMRWLCRLVAPPGGTILDPFAGSGTTLVAAGMEGRSSVGIEQDGTYCAIARDRVRAARYGG